MAKSKCSKCGEFKTIATLFNQNTKGLEIICVDCSPKTAHVKDKQWYAVEHNWSDTTVYDGFRYEPVCRLSICDEATYGNQQEMQERMAENTRMIVNAPRMMESLKELVHLHLCDQEGIHTPPPEQWADVVKKASTVIAKVTNI